jgi:hypothetical protein
MVWGVPALFIFRILGTTWTWGFVGQRGQHIKYLLGAGPSSTRRRGYGVNGGNSLVGASFAS